MNFLFTDSCYFEIFIKYTYKDNLNYNYRLNLRSVCKQYLNLINRHVVVDIKMSDKRAGAMRYNNIYNCYKPGNIPAELLYNINDNMLVHSIKIKDPIRTYIDFSKFKNLKKYEHDHHSSITTGEISNNINNMNKLVSYKLTSGSIDDSNAYILNKLTTLMIADSRFDVHVINTHAVNLTNLNIDSDRRILLDISNLSRLKKLKCSGNITIPSSCINKLTNLESLTLRYIDHDINDVYDLCSNGNLKYIKLNYCNRNTIIIDIEKLYNKSITCLILRGCFHNAHTCINNSNLIYLELTHGPDHNIISIDFKNNKLVNLTSFRTNLHIINIKLIPSLTYLNCINGYDYPVINNMFKLPKLSKLVYGIEHAAYNEEKITQLANLTSLTICDGNSSIIKYIHKITSLKILKIYDNSFICDDTYNKNQSYIYNLHTLTNLTDLTLGSPRNNDNISIKNLGYFVNLSILKKLSIEKLYHTYGDINTLSNIEVLELSSTHINMTDIRKHNLPKLRKLSIDIDELF